MKNFLVRLAAFMALLFYSGNVLFAADYAQSLLAGQRTLDFYLERAKVQTSQERFDAIMEQGIEASICEWEQSALDLKSQGLEDWIFERHLARENLKGRAQGVLCEWVMERKKSEVQEIQKSELYSELKKLADEFFYIDSDGNPSRVVPIERIAEAKSQWQNKAQEAVQKRLEGSTSERAVLDAYLVESQALNELTNKLLYDHDSLKKISDSQAALFIADKLAGQIESESGRAIDQLFNSLQSQVDFESADDVSAKKEAEQNWLLRFENELNLGLKKWSDAEEEFLAARSEWEKDAEELYINDSQKWQEAYDELQNRKVAWSQKIEAQIQEGKTQWRQKLGALEEEIDQSLREFQNVLLWENEQKRQLVQSQEEAYSQIRAILASAQSGVEIWYERWGEKYRGLYSYWKTEDNSFGKKIDLSLVNSSYLKNEILSWKENLAKSLNDCYLKICQKKYQEMLLQIEAEEAEKAKNAANGQPQGGQYSSQTYSQSQNQNENKIKSFEELYPQLACSKNSSVDEIWDACQKIMQEKSYAEDLAKEYWACLEDARVLWSAHSELFDWLDLFDEFKERAGEPLGSLYANTCDGMQIFDELSSERAKASWLLEYWESRVKIAEALVEYAQNDFSDMEKAEQSQKNLNDALERYNEAQAAYQEAFEKTSGSRLELLEEQEKYFKALSDSQEFLERIDAERRAYDDIYQKKLDILGQMAKDPALDLVADLQGLNYQSEDFKKYLWRYCSESQDDFEKTSAAQRDYVRNAAKNGCEEIGDDSGGQNFASLSLEGLESLAASLAESQEEEEGAGEADLLLVQKEIQNRRAILLLLDGSAEEIHSFFDQSSGFSEIYEKYKACSQAILQEDAEKAKEAIKSVIAGGQKDDLDEYFSALDNASKGASAYCLCAVNLYKELLLCQRDCGGVESLVGPKLLECSALLGKILYSPVDWFCDECESFLAGEASYGDAAGYDKKKFERLSYGRKELLFKIQDSLDFLLQSVSQVESLELELDRQGDAVQAIQKEYEKCLDKIGPSAASEKENPYIAACERYVQVLESAQGFYDKLEDARREYRLAQEIYFYGQNEYLHGSYNPKETLRACQESLEKARVALDALNSVQQKKAEPALDDYKDECLNYFKGRVMVYEYNERISAQVESLGKAQAVERAAAEKLVSECSINDGLAEVSSFAKSFIAASLDQDGNYSFSLNKSLDSLPQENESLLEKYFSDASVVQTDAFQNEIRSTQAKKDALDFLEGLQDKPYSLIDLAFCALHLKSLGSEEQKLSWFKSGENPELNENFRIGDLPGSIHGVDVDERYRAERLKIIQETYEKVISLGGEEDIVKFILCCDQNLSNSLDLDRTFRNALIVSAIEKPIDDVQSERDAKNEESIALLSLAAVYFIITCLPFGLGAWAGSLAAAAAAAGAAFSSMASQLGRYAEDMISVRDGCKENLEVRLSECQILLDEWQAAKKQMEEEERRLDLLLTGKDSLDGKKITWNDFERAFKEIFDQESLGVGSSYFMDLYDSASGKKGLRNFFEELSEKEDFYDVRSVMQKMSLVLQENYVGKKDSLEKQVSASNAGERVDKVWYYNSLLSFYSQELLPNLPVALNRTEEDYVADAFSLYESLAQEAMNYSAKNRLSQKQDSYSLIYADLDEQRSLWEEKNQIILDTAQKDWASALEQINFSYNSWQKEFSFDYQKSSEEWEKNYQDFLEKKEDWIYKQYLQGGGEADLSYSLVEKLKSAFGTEGQGKELAGQMCDAEKFSRMADMTKSLLTFAQNESALQNNFEKIDLSLIKNYDSAIKAQRELQKSFQDAAAKASVQQYEAQLEKRIDECLGAIEDKNKSVEKWELDMVREAGYTVDPLIHRNAISDVSFLTVKRERQDVHRYEWFLAAAPEIDLDISSYLGSSEYLTMKKVEAAQEKVQDWSAEIFGSDASPKSGGRLGEHIGRAPVFVQNIDPAKSREDNVKDFGSGQMGKILLDYQWNSILSAAAASDFSRPVYDQKLLDIDGFELPSLRDIVGVVCEIVSKVPAFYVLQYVDDAVFGLMDVGLGYKSWEEVAGEFAKQGLVAGASKAVGKAVSAVGKAFNNSSAILQNAAAGYLNNVAANYVDAIDFASGKMDWEKAASSWHDARTLTSLAGSAVGQGLGALNNVDANGLALNSRIFGDIQSMNNTIGSLAGQAFNYIATGDFSVNLINIKGVGIFELGVSDGSFKAGFGRGGADISAQSLMAFAKGAEAASKVSALKKSGVEGQTLLNAANLLAWSGGKENVSLASDLFNDRRSLVFEDGDSVPAFGKTIDETIVLNKALLGQGKEGQALVAAYASLQNLSQDGSPETFGSTLESMAQISSVLAVASQALDFDLADLQEKNSLTVLADAYKQNGIAGVYALYADVKKEADSSGQESSGLAELLEQPWFQNVAENRGILLGQSMTMEEYNKAAKQSAVERYAAQKVKDFLAKNSGASADEIKLVGDDARAKAASEIVEGVANEKYGYEPETYNTDLKNYGCTLATAAYIAYSITGNVGTLAQANEILKDQDLFVYGTDNNGVTQKNCLTHGDSYVNAVNAIAGGDYLQKDGKDFSVDADIAKGGKLVDNRQSIFDRLVKSSRDESEVYFTHMRVNGSHSVLFDSMAYTDEKNYKSSTLSVMDPWQGGKFSPKSWSDISRADFYKLTQTGKELYQLTREALRSGSAA